MTNHYIETLGLAKCREILKGAPTQDCFFDTYESMYYAKDHDHYWEWWDEDCKEWVECEFEVNLKEYGFINLDAIRAELALHDTDDFTHLENHIGPNTVVINLDAEEELNRGAWDE